MLDRQGLTNLVNRLVVEGLPPDMKRAKVVYIHKPGKTDWNHLTPQHGRQDGGESSGRLTGEQRGW